MRKKEVFTFEKRMEDFSEKLFSDLIRIIDKTLPESKEKELLFGELEKYFYPQEAE